MVICLVFVTVPYTREVFLRNSAVLALLFLYNGWKEKAGVGNRCLNKLFRGGFIDYTIQNSNLLNCC